MRLKSKYNLGEFVMFKNPTTKDIDVGKIDKIHISFSWEQFQKEEYMITPIRMKSAYLSDWVRVEKAEIRKRLDKRAFKKAYAEQCAKEMMKSE